MQGVIAGIAKKAFLVAKAGPRNPIQATVARS
jgi:hypothetical protein